MKLRIMVSRHSAFYSPLISTISAGFLRRSGLDGEYRVLAPGQRSSVLIRAGEVEIMQSAVSSNWKPMEAGESPLPVHFAQINRRDGFFLVARTVDREFHWYQLEDRPVVADHAPQPFAMLRYAARINGVHLTRVRMINAGSPADMELAFRQGQGDYVHLQSPAAHGLESDGLGHIVASVGEAMPPLAFSSLCCSRAFLETEAHRSFLEAFRQAKEWVRAAQAEELADQEAAYFPGASREVLAASIRRYQSLGCWEGGVAIPRDLYEQALNVFESEGEISRRHAYEEVCA